MYFQSIMGLSSSWLIFNPNLAKHYALYIPYLLQVLIVFNKTDIFGLMQIRRIYVAFFGGKTVLSVPMNTKFAEDTEWLDIVLI